MFYIVVFHGDERKVISDNSSPREFTKKRKAMNFINGRAYLESLRPVIVSVCPQDLKHFKVDI